MADHDAVLGYRIGRQDPWTQRAASAFFNRLSSIAFGMSVRDLNCSFKLFRGDLARAVFAELRTDGFGYDPEALYLAKKRGERIDEVGVVWRHSAPTKVAALRSSLDMFKDVVRTRFRKPRPPQC